MHLIFACPLTRCDPPAMDCVGAATMEDLSNEEVECVLGFLEAPKDLSTAAAVCHRWAVS